MTNYTTLATAGLATFSIYTEAERARTLSSTGSYSDLSDLCRDALGKTFLTNFTVQALQCGAVQAVNQQSGRKMLSLDGAFAGHSLVRILLNRGPASREFLLSSALTTSLLFANLFGTSESLKTQFLGIFLGAALGLATTVIEDLWIKNWDKKEEYTFG